jgi:sec-independent protein translocase protein TatC
MSNSIKELGGSLLEHITELVIRIRYSAIALAIGCAIGIAIAQPTLAFLIAPYGGKLQVLGPTEGVSIYVRVALTIGTAIASPFVLFHLIAFIAPGLLPHEKRAVYLVVPGAIIMFVIGAFFAWFIMIPSAIQFLASFYADVFQVQWTAEKYVPFVLSLTLWVGVSFEMPLVFMFLGWLGVVSAGMLLKGWRFAIVGCAVIAAIITPTVDPFNMALVMGPLMGLYFLSIILVWIVARRKRE